ncbi:SCO2322 family protein [Streptomyces sp. NPDC020875]|uniref:SCO2322 family protein n=1 Tax=Streptomyces sp. NPDC020875 TaxID=3154898 RepID=UPI0033C1C587
MTSVPRPAPVPAAGTPSGGSRLRPGPRSTRLRRTVGAVVAGFVVLVTAGAGVVGAAGTAQAAGYRYWSYWQADGAKWTYATEGPATARPADGAVHGFRFAVSADSSDASVPRTVPDFAAICGSTAPEPDRKRVALVVDPGTAADAPGGERPPASRTVCAVVPGDATAAEALAKVAKPLRYDANAMLCAISGYPAKGCGEQVAGSGGKSDSAAATDSASTPGSDGGDSGDGGPSVGVVAAIAVIAVLGAAAFRQSRRRSR